MHVGGQEYALQHGSQHKSNYFVEKSQISGVRFQVIV